MKENNFSLNLLPNIVTISFNMFAHEKIGSKEI